MVIMPSSNVTCTSSFLTAGNSARIRYSFSVSLMSADGAHSTLLPLVGSEKRGQLARLAGSIRLNKASTSANGSQRTSLMEFTPLCDGYGYCFRDHHRSGRAP